MNPNFLPKRGLYSQFLKIHYGPVHAIRLHRFIVEVMFTDLKVRQRDHNSDEFYLLLEWV